MAAVNRAELKQQFKSITDCKNDKEVEQYLEACTWDLATAVDLFLSRGTDEEPARRKRKEPIRGNARNGRGAGASRGGGGMTSSRITDEVIISDGEDDDEEMARDRDRKRRNGRGPSSSSTTMTSSSYGQQQQRSAPLVTVNDDDDFVRAPMQFTSGPIVNYSIEQQYGHGIQPRRNMPMTAFDGGRDYRAIAASQQAEMRALRDHRLANGRGDVSSSSSNGASSSSANGGSRKDLSSLFRPPVDIMHIGDWESAKAAAIARDAWVLINVQDIKEFASQTLNRDVWSNAGVKELVRGNFLFWQIYIDSVDGQRMRSYYGVQVCPTVFIVDPRTGEKVLDVSLKSQDPMSICDKLSRFIDDFPDFETRDRSMVAHAAPLSSQPVPAEAQGDRGAGDSGASSSSMNGSTGTRKRKQANVMTAKDDDDEDDDEEKEADERRRNGKKSRLAQVEEEGDVDRILEESTRGLTMCDEDEWQKHVVPGGDPIRVMMRFPDGTRHTLDATGATRLFALLQYIRGRGLSPEDHNLILSYPKREYSTERSEESLTQLGFSRSEMVHVETKE